MALFELFGWLKYYREKRLREKLGQKELLKREIRLIALAILVIIALMESLFALARWVLP